MTGELGCLNTGFVWGHPWADSKNGAFHWWKKCPTICTAILFVPPKQWEVRGKKHTQKNPGAIAWVRKWIIKHHQFLKDLKELWKTRFGRCFQPRDKRRSKRGMGGWTFLEAGPNALWDKRFITDLIDPTIYTFRERTKDFPWPSELLSTGTYGIIWYSS